MASREVYGTVEIARMLNVSPATAVNWIRAGKIRAWRTPGGHRRVPRQELIRFLRATGMPVPEELRDGPRKILVVDDDPGVRETLRAAFEESAEGSDGESSEIRVSADGTAGLVDVGFFRPEVLVLDIFLPGVDGFEICRRIRENEHYRPTILAISGRTEREVEEGALEAGADAFFPKPLDLEELLKAAIGSQAEAAQ